MEGILRIDRKERDSESSASHTAVMAACVEDLKHSDGV